MRILLFSLLALLGCTSTGAAVEAEQDDLRGARVPRVLFVNFEGLTVTKAKPYDPERGEASTDDPRRNLSSMIGGVVPPFDDGSFPPGARGRIVELVKKYFADFDAKVVTTRPTGNELYTMITVGGDSMDYGLGEVTDAGEDAPDGIAGFDCKDKNRAGGVAFVFSVRVRKYILSDAFKVFAGRDGTMNDVERSIAIDIAHEAGHTFGLFHIDVAHSLMHYWSNNIVVSGKEAWTAGPIAASEELVRACKDPKGEPYVTVDDPHAVLLGILGPAKK